MSCSLDGTVKAYDCTRQKMFRNMQQPDGNQLISLAIEQQGDIICTGGKDPYNIYTFQLKTGQLMEIIAGHEGPVNCLAFSSLDSTLASGSWDKTVRIHDLFSRHRNTDILNHNAHVMSVAFRPDGQHIAAATLKGDLYFWDAKSA